MGTFFFFSKGIRLIHRLYIRRLDEEAMYGKSYIDEFDSCSNLVDLNISILQCA